MTETRYFYSISQQVAWGADMRNPDDDHEDYWLPDWILEGWPSDYQQGPQIPSDNSLTYKAVFHEDGSMTWEVIPNPPVGARGEANGDS